MLQYLLRAREFGNKSSSAISDASVEEQDRLLHRDGLGDSLSAMCGSLCLALLDLPRSGLCELFGKRKALSSVLPLVKRSVSLLCSSIESSVELAIFSVLVGERGTLRLFGTSAVLSPGDRVKHSPSDPKFSKKDVFLFLESISEVESSEVASILTFGCSSVSSRIIV